MPEPPATGARLVHTTGAIARFYASAVVRLRFAVIGVWVVAAVAAAVNLPAFGSTNGPAVQLVPRDAPAFKALAESVRLFHLPAGSDFAVVERDPRGLSLATQSRIVKQAVDADRSSGGQLEFALPIVNTAKLVPSSSESGTTAVTFLYFDPALSLAAQNGLAARYAHATAARTGTPALVTGAVPAQLEQGALINRDLNRVEIATLVAIALIVLLAYRAIGASVIAMAGIAISFPITVWALGQLQTQLGLVVPQELDPVIVALLLGVVTDYAIFFLSGVRSRLAMGDDRLQASRLTAAEFTPIILTSAVILSLSLLALLVSTLGFFRDLGPALALTVGIGLAVSVTLIPALLAVFGRLAFWPSSPADTSSEDEEPSAGRSGRLLARRWVAWPTAILCLAGLGCAAWQLQYLELGLGQASDLPSDSAPHRGADAASAGFVPGILSPTSVIIQAPGIATERRSQLVQLQRLIDARPEVAATLGPGQEPVPARFGVFYASGGDAARIVVILKHDPLGASGIDDLDDLEAAMPGLVARSGLTGSHISYAGDTPLADDTVSAIGTNTVRVIAVVLVVNLLLLIVFLRSVVAPLFLLGSSVIAVAASLGLTTWVFQSVLGYGQLTYFVPFIVSVLLISLGSDYNIFVVGRIWQEANLRPLPDAVAIAAPSAARAVRAAGITLAASFAIVAVIPIRSFREIAFAMVTGVLIETFVVRSLLAPSLITVFGYVSGWPGRRLHPGAETPVHDA